jgi:hypothetical protein
MLDILVKIATIFHCIASFVFIVDRTRLCCENQKL